MHKLRFGQSHKVKVDHFGSSECLEECECAERLNMPAEKFMVDTDTDRSAQREPDLMTELAPLLRARHDLDAPTIAYIEEVVRAAVRHAQAPREGTA